MYGAKIAVKVLPPTMARVWFCPHGTTHQEWLEARLIEARKPLFEARLVRIAFRRAIPYEDFKRMVFGPEGAGGLAPPSGPAGDGEDDAWCDWV